MGDDELKQDPTNQPEDLDGQDPQRRDEEYESHHEVQPLNDEQDEQDNENYVSSEASSHHRRVPSTASELCETDDQQHTNVFATSLADKEKVMTKGNRRCIRSDVSKIREAMQHGKLTKALDRSEWWRCAIVCVCQYRGASMGWEPIIMPNFDLLPEDWEEHAPLSPARF